MIQNELGKKTSFRLFIPTESSLEKSCHHCLQQAVVVKKGQLIYRADGSVRDMTEDKLYCQNCFDKEKYS